MYINTDTLATYKSQNEIRNAFPNSCFPVEITNEILASINIMPVAETAPVFDHVIEKAVEIQPALINGVWTQQWEAVPLFTTQEEIDKAYADHLVYHKELKNDEINQARLEANNSFFMHLGKKISCDSLSRGDIDAMNGIVTLNNAMPPGWVGFWKTADNEYIPINTVDEWKAFYTSMFIAGAMNFGHAQQLKAQVAAATSHDEVMAIHW